MDGERTGERGRKAGEGFLARRGLEERWFGERRVGGGCWEGRVLAVGRIGRSGCENGVDWAV